MAKKRKQKAKAKRKTLPKVKKVVLPPDAVLQVVVPPDVRPVVDIIKPRVVEIVPVPRKRRWWEF